MLEEETVSGIRHFHYDIHTTGISYVTMYFDLYDLTEEEIPYAVLLSGMLRSLDTEKHSYTELARISNAYTGGIRSPASAISMTHRNISHSWSQEAKHSPQRLVSSWTCWEKSSIIHPSGIRNG